MNSHVIQAYPYQEADISPWQKPFICREEDIDRQILRLANRHITWTEGAPVSEGDVVQCRLISDLPKFRHDNLSLTAGAGLFDPELESELIGKKSGDAIRLEKENTLVTGTIISVKNKHVPPVTDEYVLELSLPDVSTVSEYRNRLREQQFQTAFDNDCYEPLMYIQQTVLEMSEILLRKEDWQRYTVLKLQYLKGLAAFDKLELETMTAQDFEGRIPVKSYSELVAMIQTEAWDSCRLSLLGQYLLQNPKAANPKAPKRQRQPAQDGEASQLQADYEASLQNLSDTWHKPIAECRKILPLELHEIDYYANYYVDTVTEYLKKYLYTEE